MTLIAIHGLQLLAIGKYNNLNKNRTMRFYPKVYIFRMLGQISVILLILESPYFVSKSGKRLVLDKKSVNISFAIFPNLFQFPPNSASFLLTLQKLRKP